MKRPPKVWWSGWPSETWYVCLVDVVDEHRSLNERLEIFERLRQGEKVTADDLPKRVAFSYSGKKPHDFMDCAGIRAVSRRAREVLERFDLGETQFFPFEFFQRSGSKIDGEYFFVNVTEASKCVVPEKSEVKVGPDNGRYYQKPTGADILAIDRLALPSTDLWTDPLMARSVTFFSDDLRQACKAEKLTKIRFKKATVIDS